MKGVIPAIILNTSACEIPHFFFQRVEVGRVGRKDEKAERQRERESEQEKKGCFLKKKELEFLIGGCSLIVPLWFQGPEISNPCVFTTLSSSSTRHKLSH